ncbi:hypothetical protein [Sphingomonas mucosissima]|nr:hypothetical protein [Sphingomonas mucosissima]
MQLSTEARFTTDSVLIVLTQASYALGVGSTSVAPRFFASAVT